MGSTSFVHLAARAYRCSRPLTDHDVASWMWSRLTRAFPDALAAVIMPDHVHLITITADAETTRQTLARVVGNLSRTRVAPEVLRWGRVEPPGPIDDAQKLLRSLRYVALNPVRAGLVRDPLAWPWSTHRDVMGAIAEPWVTDERLARLLGRARAGYRDRFHRYVSADPSCAVEGTSGVRRATDLELAQAPLAWIADAAAAATRGSPEDICVRSTTRALFLALTARARNTAPRYVARACAITRNAVHASWSRVPHAQAVDAALHCLGDPRLRIPSRRRAAVADGCACEMDGSPTSPGDRTPDAVSS